MCIRDRFSFFSEGVPVVVLSVNHRTPSCGKACEVVLLSQLFLRCAMELGHCRMHQLTIRALYVCSDCQSAQLAIFAGNGRVLQAVLLPQRPVVNKHLLRKRFHKARNNAKGLFDILEGIFIITHFITGPVFLTLTDNPMPGFSIFIQLIPAQSTDLKGYVMSWQPSPTGGRALLRKAIEKAKKIRWFI